MMNSQSKLGVFSSYLKLLLDKTGASFYISLAVMVFLGLTEGVGLLFIIPIVGLTGVGGEAVNSGKLGQFVESIFNYIGFSPSLLSVLLVYLAIISFYAVLKYFQSVLNVQLSQGLIKVWRNDVYKQLTYAKWEFIVRRKLPELAHVLTKEIAKVGQGTNQFVQIIGNVIILMVQIVLAMLISPILTTVAVLSTLILGAISKSFNRKSYELGAKDFGAGKQLHTMTFEQLAALKLAKSYGVEEQTISKVCLSVISSSAEMG
ncbi:ABC transporter transmembrane domain-containing protein, partial [Bacteroidota bacterium]